MSLFPAFSREARCFALAGLLFSTLFGCHPATPAAAHAPAPKGAARNVAGPAASQPPALAGPFQCNLLLGVAVTSEWFDAGFERVVDGARWESITRPHTSLEQWADPQHPVWAQVPSSPCAERAQQPDRVLFTAMNWEYTSAAQWQMGLIAVVSAIRAHFPSAREIDLLTMLRAPGNASCGNAMSVVQPFVDEAVRAVAARFPELVRVGPKLEAPSCDLFKDGGPHFTDWGRSVVAEHVGEYFAREPNAPPPQVVFPSEPIEPVAAPFPMPQFVRPKFPGAVFDIRDFGAQADAKTKNTEAIRRAIQQAASAGGGTVLVPAGRFLTGPIQLKSNINLYLAGGAELLFSQDFADYLPPVFTRWEGTEAYSYSPLIYAKDCQNVAITGPGKLNGQGQAWWPWKKSKAAAEKLYDLAAAGVPPERRVFDSEGSLRPSFIQTVRCKNVLIEGVTITSGPFWTIHPLYSENVIIRRVRVATEGPNTDGCDPDSSKNVLIEDSFFSTGDDCVVIKSGLNEDGWRVGKPSENIVVRRLHGERGHGGVVIGSEMSGGVKNVWVTDSEFKGTDRGLRIKSMRGRGGSIENVFYENVRHEDLRLMAVEVTTFYNSSNVKPKTERPPTIRGVHVKNITTHGAAQAIDIVGLPELPIQDVTFDDVEIASQRGVRCIDCKGVRFSRTKIAPQSGAPFQLDGAHDVSFDATCSGAPSACIERVGRPSTDLRIDGKVVPERALPLHPKPASASAQ